MKNSIRHLLHNQWFSALHPAVVIIAAALMSEPLTDAEPLEVAS